MKTAEEIKKLALTVAEVLGIHEDPINNENAQLELSMSELLKIVSIEKKQEAEAFAEWIFNEGWAQITSGQWALINKIGGSDMITTSELFQLYKQQSK